MEHGFGMIVCLLLFEKKLKTNHSLHVQKHFFAFFLLELSTHPHCSEIIQGNYLFTGVD